MKMEPVFVRAHLLRLPCEQALGDNMPGPGTHPRGSVAPSAGLLQPLGQEGRHPARIYGLSGQAQATGASASTLQHCRSVTKHMPRPGIRSPWAVGLCGVRG